MNRRLFVGKAAIGLVLPFLPAPLLAESSAASQPINVLIDQVSTSISRGMLGAIQRLRITHLYDPTEINWDTLLTIAQQDITLVTHLINSPLDIRLPKIPQASFGSGSIQQTIQDMIVTWEGLACLTPQTGSASGKLQIIGSKGILHAYLDGSSFIITDFQGKAIVSKGKSNLTAKTASVRHRFINTV